MAQCNVEIMSPAVEAIWASQPLLDTELFGVTVHRVWQDVTNFTEVRLCGNVGTVAAFAGATLYAEYSILGTFADNVLIDSALGTGCAIPINVSGNFASAWAVLDPLAIAAGDVAVRVMGVGGNGAVDPTFGNITLEFR